MHGRGLQIGSRHLAINRRTLQLHFEPRAESTFLARLADEINDHDSAAGRQSAAELRYIDRAVAEMVVMI